jgi:PTS system cellobiose-specific IIC component
MIMEDKKKSDFLNEKLLPGVMKVVNTKAISAIKNGMVYSLPFIIVGSVFLILSNIPIESVATYMNDSGLSDIFSQAYAASFGLVALISVVGMAYVYVRDAGYEPLPAGITALSAFLIVQQLHVVNPVSQDTYEGFKTLPNDVQALLDSPVGGVINLSWMGGQGMIAAIIIGLLTGWAYSAILKAGWKISLPEQVPANVANQFTAMVPAALCIAGATAIFGIFKFAMNSDLLTQIYEIVQTPLQGLSDSLPGILLVSFLIPFLWFFGVHGAMIIGGIMSAILIPNTFDNAQHFKDGTLTISQGAHVVTNEFLNNFINLTGTGVTIGLLIFILLRAKSAQLKSLGKIEIGPALFNINEPFLFGIPIVYNPLLAIPFILTPMMVSLSTYLVIYFGIIPPFNGLAAPWTTPPVISGFIIGGWKMAIWQAVTLLLSTAIWWPFGAMQDKVLLKQEQEAEAAALASAVATNK